MQMDLVIEGDVVRIENGFVSMHEMKWNCDNCDQTDDDLVVCTTLTVRTLFVLNVE